MNIEFWAKSAASGESMISYATTMNPNSVLIEFQNNMRLIIAGGVTVTGVAINDNLFHHIVVQWRSSDGTINVYKDGILAFTTTGVAVGNTVLDGGSLVLSQDQDSVGGGFDGNMSYNGILDEVRIGDTFKSVDYIKTTHNNQNDTSLFYSIGSNEVQFNGIAILINEMRPVDETTSINEQVNSLRTLEISVDETINIVDLEQILLTLTTAVDESINIVDRIDSFLSLVSSVDETINVDELINILETNTIAINETINILENIVNSKKSLLLKTRSTLPLKRSTATSTIDSKIR